VKSLLGSNRPISVSTKRRFVPYFYSWKLFKVITIKKEDALAGACVIGWDRGQCSSIAVIATIASARLVQLSC